MAARDSESAAEQGREEALQQRLDEMRRERESELKRIRRLAEPSVEGGRRLLSQLMNPRQQASGSEEAESPPSNQTASARAAVLVEVRGLFESRPVSRILQSSSFRTELESIVRSSLTPRAPAAAASAASPPPSSQTPAAPTSTTTSNFADLMRQRRDEFVEEIGELLHSQLVTNTLVSGFRGRLETSVRLRADALPDGGRRALESIGSLPPSRIARNDFSHLGIVPPDQQSVSGASSSDQLQDDAISVVSLTAAGAVADSGIGRQMRQMQKEMTELKRMMRQLMNGQLETQRMVRQEVNSAMADRLPQEAPQASTPARAGACLVCLTSSADTVMYRCGHLCLCASCSLEMRARNERMACPVCRATVTDTMRVYVAGIAPDDD